MALISAETYEHRLPANVKDAKGRELRDVVACDPLTGEVIDCKPVFVGSDRVRFVDRHWFAPAPLTITPAT